MNTPADVIEVIEYNQASYRTYMVNMENAADIEELAKIPDSCIRWINADGLCSETALAALGRAFDIHSLVLRNISDTTQRAKVEEYQSCLYIAGKMLFFSNNELIVEHMSFILGPRYVITVGETKGDVFENIRTHIAAEGSSVRNSGADYLLYLMLDALAEGYFTVLETVKENIDTLEDRVMTKTEQEHLQQIQNIKRELIRVSKCIWPLRDVASLLGRESLALIRPTTEPYLRDVYSHIVQAIDTTETCRDLLSGLADLHISNTSYKLNEIMKVLTIISTIFIPLTFIAGVYGMNFLYMPELQFKWGYGIVWAVMLIVAGCMIYYFKKKKWF